MFDDKEWTVKMVGYLYCKELEELNHKIAIGEIMPSEFTTVVRRHPSMMPTTALSAWRLMEDFSINEDRAQVRHHLSYMLLDQI